MAVQMDQPAHHQGVPGFNGHEMEAAGTEKNIIARRIEQRNFVKI
jgi:hypothetical protein